MTMITADAVTDVSSLHFELKGANILMKPAKSVGLPLRRNIYMAEGSTL